MSELPRTSVQWQQVKCDRCGREYQCTPWDGHCETPQGDHCCETCLLKGTTMYYLIEQEDGTITGPRGPLVPLAARPEEIG